MSKRDYYEILGIDCSAGDSEIKTAYRKLAMKFHPDRNPDSSEAEERFKEATEAYEILKDQGKRQMYDQYGHAGVNQNAGGFGGGGFGAEFDLGDALRAFMRDFGGGGGGGSIFDDFFGMGGGQNRRHARGEDLRIKLKLTLEEIATGIEKSIKVNRIVTCEVCDGSGVAAGSSRSTCHQCKGAGKVRQITKTFLGTVQQVATCNVCRGTGEVIANPCKSCDGQGRKRGSSKVDIKVPPGVSSGNYMTVENMGNAAPNNGQPGDLNVIFEEVEHDLYTRHWSNILSEVPVSFTMAALGGSVKVKTLGEEVELKIPQGTQPGKLLKMRGKGIPHLNRSGRGDHMVRVVVWVPTKLGNKEKELLKKLESSALFKAPEATKSFFNKLRDTLGV